MRVIPKLVLAAVVLTLVAPHPAPAQETAVLTGSGFEQDFSDATLRVDLFHAGNAESELLALDRLYRQGVWAGSCTQLIDPFPYGSYRVEASDAESGRLLFSRGYDTYFGEYRTTDEAGAGRVRVFHESVLLPFPKRPMRLSFVKPGRQGEPVELLTTTIDPQAIEISDEPLDSDVVIVEQHVSGDPHTCLDLVIVGEGYTAGESDAFRSDLQRFSEVLLQQEPFASLRDSISIRGVLQPSQDSGCDEPTRGHYRNTSVGASFNALDSPRYMLIEDHQALRDVAAHVPYDAIAVMVNSSRYGGGGIYNLYATFTAHNYWSPYVLVHELGHSFAGLADEYYSSQVAYTDFYPKGIEPNEPNITALLGEDGAPCKWQDLVSDGVEIPTTWEKAEYDAMDGEYQRQRRELYGKIAEASRNGAPAQEVRQLEDELEELSRTSADKAHRFLAASTAAGLVGAFEGAGYCATGLYRPSVDCIMFSKRLQPFCPVCARAVAAMIKRYTE